MRGWMFESITGASGAQPPIAASRWRVLPRLIDRRWFRAMTYVFAVILGMALAGLCCGCSGLVLDRTDGGGDRLEVGGPTWPRQLAPCPPVTPTAD